MVYGAVQSGRESAGCNDVGGKGTAEADQARARMGDRGRHKPGISLSGDRRCMGWGALAGAPL